MTRTLALYPAGVAALLLALPLIAPRTGPLALANIFSIHLALAALLLVPIAIATRRRALTIALAVLVVVSIARFGSDWVSAPFARDASDGLYATASWNLELGARSGPDAVDVLRTIDVDVIALQELGPEHVQAIEASQTLTSRFPHRALYPDLGVLGMGLLSRDPILRVEHDQDPAVIEAVVDTGYGEVTVIDAHPLAGRLDMAGPIPVGFDAAKRDERLARIRTRIVAAIARGEPVILLGDLNTTPFEPGYADIAAGLHDAHAEVGQGPGWTWRPSRLEWTRTGFIRIDHALSSPPILPVSASEHCERVGDHCILEVWFSMVATGGDSSLRPRSERQAS